MFFVYGTIKGLCETDISVKSCAEIFIILFMPNNSGHELRHMLENVVKVLIN